MGGGLVLRQDLNNPDHWACSGDILGGLNQSKNIIKVKPQLIADFVVGPHFFFSAEYGH